MTRIRVGLVIPAPPAVVWEAVRDIRTHPAWMKDAVSVVPLSGSLDGVGGTFACETKVGPFRTTDVMEITEWKPRKAMGVRHAGAVTGAGRFTLKRTLRGHTRFMWDERLTFPWWMGGPVGSLLATPVLVAIWRGNLRRLRALVVGD